MSAESKVVAARYGVSERTARRHLSRGVLPGSLRIVGKDGRTYPAAGQPAPGSYRSRGLVGRDLQIARAAIRRMSRTREFTDADYLESAKLRDEADALFRRWVVMSARA